jgi:hypothetical protein
MKMDVVKKKIDFQRFLLYFSMEDGNLEGKKKLLSRINQAKKKSIAKSEFSLRQ